MKRWLLVILIAMVMLPGGWQAKAQDGKRPVITSENVSQITLLQRLGRGSFEIANWSPDGKILVIAGSMGLWLYDADHLEQEPRLIEAYGVKQSLTFSPDSQWAALSTAWDKLTVRLWNLTTGQEGPTFEGGDALFSPDGKVLASRTLNTIFLWDVATGEKLHSLEGHTEYPRGLAFSPDSTLVASSSWDGSARLWDVMTGQMLFEWDDHSANGPAGVPAVTFTPDGTQVITAGEDGTIRWWNVATGKSLRVAEGPTNPSDLKFWPDSKTLAVATMTSSKDLWVLDASTGERLRLFERTYNSKVCFSPDGTLLVSPGAVLNAATGEKVAELEGSEKWANWQMPFSFDGPQFRPDGTQIAAVLSPEVAWSGTVWVWDAHTGKRVTTLQGLASIITDAAFSPDSRQLVSAGVNHVRLWDVDSGAVTRDFTPGFQVVTAAFSPDGSFIAAGDRGYGVHLLNPATGQENRVFKGQPLDSRYAIPDVTSLAFSPDGKLLASAGYDAATKVWDVAEGQPLYVLGSWTVPVTDLAFSPDGMLLARASGVGGPTLIWKMSRGEEICRLLGGSDYRTAYSVVFSPDGTQLIESSKDGVLVWDVKTCQQVRALHGNTGQIADLALSPDGKLLAGAGWDGVIRLWDLATGEQLPVLDFSNPAAGKQWIQTVTFSPDGTLMAAEFGGGEIWLLGVPKSN